LLFVHDMAHTLCLIADPSPAMSGLMRDVLVDAGYEALIAENALHLADQVHLEKLLSADVMLLVIGAKWASQCAMSISVAATQRHQLGLPPASVVLVYEWGTLGVLDLPQLHHCDTVAVLEKPFEMDALKEVARSVGPALVATS
jgi:hypothetical protein